MDKGHGSRNAYDTNSGFEAQCAKFVESAAKGGALEPRMRELVNVALNASVTHLNEEELEKSTQAALAAGATPEEVEEVLQLISVLGIHALSTCMPILLDIMKERSGSDPLTATLNEKQLHEKEEFVAARGYWASTWDNLVRFDLDFFKAYSEFSSFPWNQGRLAPKEREFIYIAIDCSTTHLYLSGTRLHMLNALQKGATVEEIFEVIKISSVMGVQSYSIGMRVLQNVLSDAAPDVDRSV